MGAAYSFRNNKGATEAFNKRKGLAGHYCIIDYLPASDYWLYFGITGLFTG
jgi:hypothetical protein